MQGGVVRQLNTPYRSKVEFLFCPQAVVVGVDKAVAVARLDVPKAVGEEPDLGRVWRGRRALDKYVAGVGAAKALARRVS